MIRAVVFDLFHTLTAREEEWGDLPWTSDHLGIPRDEWYRALTEDSRARLCGEIADPVQIVRVVAHRCRPGLPDDRIAQAAAFRVQRFARALSAIPAETLEVLRVLRQQSLLLGLISNADSSEVGAWQHSPLRGLFDVEVFSCEVGSVKPEPAIYLGCLERLGVAPAEAIFVGDGGSNELAGARQLGMRTVLFSGVIRTLWPERIPDLARDATHHIERLADLVDIVGAASA